MWPVTLLCCEVVIGGYDSVVRPLSSSLCRAGGFLISPKGGESDGEDWKRLQAGEEIPASIWDCLEFSLSRGS